VANERCNFSIKAHAQLSIGMNITTAEGANSDVACLISFPFVFAVILVHFAFYLE